MRKGGGTKRKRERREKMGGRVHVYEGRRGREREGGWVGREIGGRDEGRKDKENKETVIQL